MKNLYLFLVLLAGSLFAAPGDTVAIDTTAPVYYSVPATGKHFYGYRPIHPGAGGGSYTLPTATSSTLGGVKAVGGSTGIRMSTDTIRLTGAPLYDSLGWPAYRDRYALNFPTLANTDIWTTETFVTGTYGGQSVTPVIPANTFTAATIGSSLKFVFDLGIQFILPTDVLSIRIYGNGTLLGSVGVNVRQAPNMPSGRPHILRIEASLMQTGYATGTVSGRFHGTNSIITQDGASGDIDIGGIIKSSDGIPSFDGTVDQTITIGLQWNSRYPFGQGITRLGNRFLWGSAATSSPMGAVYETSSENIIGSMRKIYARLNDRVGLITNAVATDGANCISANNAGIITRSPDGGRTWREIPHGLTTANLVAATYNRTSKTFFVAGVGGVVLKSSDGGVTWASVTNAQTWDIYAIAAVSGGFVAVGNSTTQYLITTDGTTVTTGTNSTSQVLRSIWCNGAGNWVAVGSSGANLFYNGSTVASGKTTGITCYSVYYDETGSKWWVGGATLWSASDPSTAGTWTQSVLPSSGFDTWSNNVFGINSLGSYFIITNSSGDKVFFSTNAGGTWARLAYSNGVWYGDNASIKLGL